MRVCRGIVLLCICIVAGLAGQSAEAPFNYAWGTAYAIMPETHNNESGYFSLCEGKNGKIYVGAAKYGVNAYLVEYNPISGQQRIVIDVNQVCGTTGTGDAAQAKIHTRNYVAPSGVIYVGSMHGHHREPGSDTGYPGGFVMRYDPQTEQAESLGMPMEEDGVIDVVADEARGLLYVCSIGRNHWLVGSITDKTYRDLDTTLLPFASTLLDGRGRAHALTEQFELATYDPTTATVQRRPIFVGKQRWQPESNIPVWVSSLDGRYAYLIMMNDPRLLRIDLLATGKTIVAQDLGLMTDGKNPDSRSGLAMGPDGTVYGLIRVDNTTGFGGGYLHHLLRYDPKTKKHADLGVLAVQNPDFFAWQDKKPWTHGYHRLPDGALTPLHAHMGLAVGADNTIYTTILYPYTLLRIDAYRTPVRAKK